MLHLVNGSVVAGQEQSFSLREHERGLGILESGNSHILENINALHKLM